MAKIQLSYAVKAGLQSVDAFAAQVAAVELYDGELEQLGMIVLSDDTAPSGNRFVTRTILLETTALGDSLWLTEDQLKAATRNLYTAELELRVPALVRPAEPVVTEFTPPAC